MKLNLCIFLSIFLLCQNNKMLAQGENNKWCFGHKTGMDFNTNPPTFFQHNMRTMEGSACVSDNAGNLLFYSSGAYCWDRNGNLMPNGQGLSGNGPAFLPWASNIGSSCSGVAIIKSPSNSNQYYLLTTDAIEDQLFNAYYSVIDMTLNGGMGDVISTQKNILLATDIAEGIVTTRSAGCDGYWAVIHKKLSSDYLAFKIGMNGISTAPVVSTGFYGAGSNPVFNGGYMAFNNSATRFVRGGDSLEVSSFDNLTGVLSSFLCFQTPTSYFAFSSDDSRLYTAAEGKLNQYNLTLWPNAIAINNSRVVLDTINLCAIRLGPNGKMYTRTSMVNSISVINNPNALGLSCQYVRDVMALPVYVNDVFLVSYEFGNHVAINPAFDSIASLVEDTTLCFKNEYTFQPSSYLHYLWNDGSNLSQLTVNQDGTYWVYGLENCKMHIDTFKIHFNNFNINLGPDTSICEGKQMVLDATTPNATYQWQDNTGNPTYTVSNKGIYTVKVSVDKCSALDSIVIGILDPYLSIVEPDTLICKGTPFTLHAEAYPESNYGWSTGSQVNVTDVISTGVYTVTASNVCGTFTDSVAIETQDCFCNAFMPNAFTPNGDGSNDVLAARLNCPGMSGFVMKIFNRYGQKVFESNDITNGWNGDHNGRLAELGTYFYYIQYKDKSGQLIKKKGDVVLVR